MAQDTFSAAAHVTDFRSTGDEATKFFDKDTKARRETPLDRRMEAEAKYCSRRAREERQASSRAISRKCRDVHLELALAYEFRAHLFTQQLCDCAASQLHAL